MTSRRAFTQSLVAVSLMSLPAVSALANTLQISTPACVLPLISPPTPWVLSDSTVELDRPLILVNGCRFTRCVFRFNFSQAPHVAMFIPQGVTDVTLEECRVQYVRVLPLHAALYIEDAEEFFMDSTAKITGNFFDLLPLETA